MAEATRITSPLRAAHDGLLALELARQHLRVLEIVARAPPHEGRFAAERSLADILRQRLERAAHRGTSISPCSVNSRLSRVRIIMPGRSEGMCISIFRLMSTIASGSVDSRISRSSSMITLSQSINSCVEQSSSLSLRNRIWMSWIELSSIGVAELKMMCRSPEGYSMSIVRQNGMNHWLRILRLVHGSVVPVARAAIGGLRTATIVSATKPYSVSIISYFSGLGWLMSPNVPLCTNAKCALSKEFSIIRNAEQPQLSSN